MIGRFVVYGEFDKNRITGIEKKIDSQIGVFNKYGLNCQRKILPTGIEKCGRLIGVFLRFIPGSNLYPRWQWEEEYLKLDYLYFRRPLAMTVTMRKFLRKVKEKNPDIRIIMEIPTFPYDRELRTAILFPCLWKDRFNRKKMRDLIDAIAVVSTDESLNEIWEIPAVPFRNGYDVESVQVADDPRDDECVDLCCVAMFAPWHGYERLLLGMKQYYENGGTREIKCHMIGDGRECIHYKKIANNSYIKNRVIFYGRQSGEKLTELYNKMDIAVCSLGTYKRSNSGIPTSELKSREYMAKGLPMITGCKIDVLEEKNVDFVCEFENNDSILDMDRIVAFYDYIIKKDHLRAEIRQFALETVDMSKTMKPIVELIKSL